MHINFYINKLKIKSKTIILLAILSLAVLPLFCIPFYSHKTNKPENSPEDIKLPIVMYHLILKNPGVKNRFIISVDTFEEDLRYIKANGYTTILVKDLIDYTENKKELPKKPIILTFDDGAYNNYLYAFPLAKKYEAKFIFSPISKKIDKFTEVADKNPSYAYADWNQILEMANSKLVEIQNHTYDMHSDKKPRIGCTKMSGEAEDHYKEKLTKDLLTAQKTIKEKVNTEPTAFFYPFGAYSESTEKIVKSLGFKATFNCESKVNLIKKDSECLYGLCRFLRPPGVPSAIFFEKFRK